MKKLSSTWKQKKSTPKTFNAKHKAFENMNETSEFGKHPTINRNNLYQSILQECEHDNASSSKESVGKPRPDSPRIKEKKRRIQTDSSSSKKHKKENTPTVDINGDENNQFRTNELHASHPQSEKQTKVSSIRKTRFSSQNTEATSSNKSGFISNLKLSNWGLPLSVVEAYQEKGITEMFQWQAECLSVGKVLQGGNLVYSAPTSAGKTMVAEILMLKRVLENKQKALLILPFVSVAREKMFYLQGLFQNAGVRVDGYMGSHNPAGGISSVDIAVCTIEKANGLINRLLEEGKLNQLGILVVDELHMVGDSHRGYLLELLLTKILFTSRRNLSEYSPQIVGMSATLPNLDVLAAWLKADLYHTDFRPIPLDEYIKIGKEVFNSSNMTKVKELSNYLLASTGKEDVDHSIFLCLETVVNGNSALVFCPAKQWCEKLAENIAREIYELGKRKGENLKLSETSEWGSRLREVLNGRHLSDVCEQLKRCPAGLDSILALTIPFGVAFHHAGLTFDERDIIEGAYRHGQIKVLVATTTLSSGVNLPARRVIIRSPLAHGHSLDVLCYKQMVGRAGRKGVDTEGESILICKNTERNLAMKLVSSTPNPVRSCLIKHGSDNISLSSSLKRAILEVIASDAANSPEDVSLYASCTLLATSLAIKRNCESSTDPTQSAVHLCISYLTENEFIYLQEISKDGNTEIRYAPSRLGKAVLSSSLSPDEALSLLRELKKAHKCFVLENELHLVYEVTPPFLSEHLSSSVNWMEYLVLWDQLPLGMKKVGELVGVEECFLASSIGGNNRNQTKELAIHLRFYAALALHDLVQEMKFTDVVKKYKIPRGVLQSLQQSASTFAGMVTAFCKRLGWRNMELLIKQFQQRLHFGVQQELCDLVRLSTLNAQLARVLYDSGYETASALAKACSRDIELILKSAKPFQSKYQEAETQVEGCHVWITGMKGVTEREAAALIVKEAQFTVEKDLGIEKINWINSQTQQGNAKDINQLNQIDSGHVSVIGLASYKDESKTNKTDNQQIETEDRNSKIKVHNISTKDHNVGSKDHNIRIKNPNTATVDPNISTVDPNISTVDPNISTVDPNISTVDPNISTVDPNISTVDPNISTVDPNISTVDPNISTVDPNISTVDPNISTVDPNISTVDPNISTVDPNISTVDPNISTVDPNISTVDPNISTVDPNISTVDPNISTVDPNISTVDPNISTVDPNISTVDPNISTVDPNISTVDPNISTVDPNISTVDPNISTVDPNISTVDPNIATDDHNIATDDHNISTVDPNIATDDHNIATNKNLEMNILSQPSITTYTENINNPRVSSYSEMDIDDSVFRFSDSIDLGLEKTSTPSCTTSHKIQFTVKTFSKAVSKVAAQKKINGNIQVPLTNFVQAVKEVSDWLPNCIPGKSLDKTKVMRHSNNFDDYNMSLGSPFSQENFKNTTVSNFNQYEKNLDNSSPKSEDLFLSSPHSSLKEVGNDPRINLSNWSSTTEEVENCKRTKKLKCGTLNAILFNEGFTTLTSDICNNLDLKHSKSTSITLSTEPVFSKLESENEQDMLNNAQFGSEELDKSLGQLKKDLNTERHSQSQDNSILFENNEISSKISNKLSYNETIGNSLLAQIDNMSSFEDFLEPTPPKSSSIKHTTLVSLKENAKRKNLTSNNVGGEENFTLSNSLKDQLENMSSFEDFIEPTPQKTSSSTYNELISNQQTKQMRLKITKYSKKMHELTKTNIIVRPSNKSEKPNTSISLLNGLNCDIFEESFEGTDLNVSGCRMDKESSFHSILSDDSFNSFLLEKDDVQEDSFTIAPTPQEKKEIVVKIPSANINSNTLCTSQSSIQTRSKSCLQENNESLTPSTCDGFCIIDVASDRELLEVFLKEWKEKDCFSLSFACENCKISRNSNVIGANIIQDGKFNQMVHQSGTVVGFSVCWGSKDSYYVNLQDPVIERNFGTSDLGRSISKQDRMSALFQGLKRNSNVKVYMFDMKHQLNILSNSGIEIRDLLFDLKIMDPKVANWLIDPSTKEKTLHALTVNYLMEHVDLLSVLHGPYNTRSIGCSISNNDSGRVRSSCESVVVFHLMSNMLIKLKENNLEKSFIEIEMPTLLVLSHMDQFGFGYDPSLGSQQKNQLVEHLKYLEKIAFKLAKRSFNLISPKDVSKVLYKELRLPHPGGDSKNTDTGKLTLGRLKLHHPLPGIILEWRRVSCAINKILNPLLKSTENSVTLSMHRICSESYTLTNTGRITLKEPNMQNIPKDFEITAVDSSGSLQSVESEIISLRNGFYPFKGAVFLSADYSQLELRILAHLSNETKLKRILNTGEDVFISIASQWLSISKDIVTKEQRQRAKQICYGIIYGIGSKSLAEQLEVNEDEAIEFMTSFHRSYPKIQLYIKKIIINCQTNGFVETLFSRRRYLPAITSSNVTAKSAAERQAVNTTIQGSAADLVKKAMIKIHKELNYFKSTQIRGLKKKSIKPCDINLVLQLHDELIYEIPFGWIDSVAKIIKHNMECVAPKGISLPVNLRKGPTWGNLEGFVID